MNQMKDVLAVSGMVLMLGGILAVSAGIFAGIWQHWHDASTFRALCIIGGGLVAILAGSFLMERGEVDPTPDKH